MASLDGVQAGDTPLTPSPEPRLTIPPFFVKHEDAINYQFQSYYGSDPPSLKYHGKQLTPD